MASSFESNEKGPLPSASTFSIASVAKKYWVPISIGIIAVSALAIFFQDINIIGAEALGSDYYNFVLLIPFLSGYLIYRKRKYLAAVMPMSDDKRHTRANLAIGISSLVVSMILYLYGSGTTFATDYQLLALEVFLGASILLFFNRKTLWLLTVPLLLFVAAFPSLTEYGLSFWMDMSWASVLPAHWVLVNLIGLNVAISLPTANIPTLVLTTSSGASYSFAVAVASSGIYSVIGFTLFAAFLGYICRGSFLRKIALFLLAYPLLILINILREIILVSVANLWGIIAFNAFHATSGIVLVFIVTLVILILGERLFKLEFFQTNTVQKSCSFCVQEKSIGHSFCVNCGKFLQHVTKKVTSGDAIAIAALVIVTMILMVNLVPAIAVASAPTSIPIKTVSAANADAFLPQIPGWNLSFVYRDTYVQEALDQDAALVYTYTQEAGSTTNPTTIFAIVQVMAGTHTPENSLIIHPALVGANVGVNVLSSQNVMIMKKPYLVGTFFAYRQSNATAAYVYWISRAAFNFGSYSDFRNIEFSLWQQSSSLVASGAIPNATDLAAIKQVFLPLAQSIAAYWRPLSSNSILLTVFQKWNVPFLAAAILPAAIFEGESFIRQLRDGNNSKKMFRKTLTSQDGLLLETLNSFTSKTWPGITRGVGLSLQQILAIHKSKTGEDINPIEGLKQLTYLEHMGFVRRQITSDEFDQPLEVWKTTQRI